MNEGKRGQSVWQSLYWASRRARSASEKTARLIARAEARTLELGARPSADRKGYAMPARDYLDETFPQIRPLDTAEGQLDQRPSVTIFCFLRPQGFFGGVATLLLVGAYLAQQLEFDLRIVQTTGFARAPDVAGFLRSNGVQVAPDRLSIVDVADRGLKRRALPLHRDDVVVVSAWWDAHVAARLPLRRPFVYLIQDFEPLFYNSSDAWLLAHNTYTTGKFVPLLNTSLLRGFFETRGYQSISENAEAFEPAVNRLPVRTRRVDDRRRRLFFYARPGVDRNLFYTGLAALTECVGSGGLDSNYEWEICCAGEDDVSPVQLAQGVIMKSLGKLDSDSYRRLLETVDVAVSLMLAPHPNYPTLEFAASGAAVVTTAYETKRDLTRYSENIEVALPTVDSLSAAIARASRVSVELRMQRAAASNIESDWNLALREPLSRVVARLD
jgi:hypothetical protein